MNDKPPITGYRNLTKDEIDLINVVKQHGEALRELIEGLADLAFTDPDLIDNATGHSIPTVDSHWLSVAEISLQTGIMQLIRSIAQPTSF